MSQKKMRGRIPKKVSESSKRHKGLLVQFAGSEYNKVVDLSRALNMSFHAFFTEVIRGLTVSKAGEDERIVSQPIELPKEYTKPRPSKRSRRETEFLREIRVAVGDPYEKLTQSALLKRIKDLRAKSIDDCVAHISEPEIGTAYDWLPDSPMSKTVAMIVRRLSKFH